ncbi:MAG: membrane dipeptidase [Proteobacteria bacterium]|nr:membrane dipeptidase [Pseudomonadota bacterium]
MSRISETSLDKAINLHRRAFTFDFLPMGSPFVMTPRHESVMRRELERQAGLGTVLRAMMNDRLDELVEDPDARATYFDVWRRSGVKAIQTTLGGIEVDPCGWDAIVRDVGWYAHAERHARILRICRTADELEQAARDGVLGVLMGTQDAGWVDPAFGRLQTLHQAGLRVLQVTYNQRNLLGDGCSEPADAGLSRLGCKLVAQADALGIILDVSHCGYRTTREVIASSRIQAAVTHSACAALNPHPRAKPDDVLEALRDRDGYFGVVAVPAFLRKQGTATLDDLLRHLEHAARIVGLHRVGVATDWGAVTPDLPPELAEATRQAFIRAGFKPEELPAIGVGLPEFDDWCKWPHITAGLFERGFSEAEVAGLIGGNWLSYMRRALPADR